MIGVIGAHGFIGRSLIDHFNAEQTPVTAFVRQRRPSDRYNFGPLPDIRELTLGGDFDPDHFAGMETVVLSASMTNPRTPENSKEAETRKNVLPHMRFVEQLRTTDVKHLIFLSSGGTVYGDAPQNQVITETHATNPITDYGFGKLCIEQALIRIWHRSGRQLTILRPSNPTGKHQLRSLNQHGLIPTVFDNIVSGRTISVFGNGQTVRDYFAVEELCELIGIVASDLGSKSKILNVSSGTGHSIKHVIEIAKEVLRLPARVHFRLGSQPRIDRNILSNQAAFRIYGWHPKRSVGDIFEQLKEREMQNALIQNVISA